MKRPLLVLSLFALTLVLASCPPPTVTPVPTTGMNPGPATYKLSYLANGASGSMPSNGVFYTEGRSVTIADQGGLYLTGKTFVGWNTEANSSGTSYAAGSVLNFPAHDVDLYAQWTDGSTFSIIYLSPTKTSGSEPSDVNRYAAGSAAVIKGGSDLARSGYLFAGWTESNDGSGSVYSPDQSISMGNSDLILYARWLLSGTIQYSVSYARGSSSVTGTPPVDSNLYASGMTVTVKGNSDLARTDYSFAGWTYGGTTYAPGDTLTVGSSNIAFTASWTYHPTYGVTYNANGGTGSVPQDSNAYESGASVTLLPPGGLTNGSLVFGGWYTNSACTGTRYAAGGSYFIYGNVTFYAKWVPVRHISYSANGGSGTAPVDASDHIPGEIAQLAGQGNLTLADSDFIGWNTKADGSGIHYVSGSSIPMKDADLALFAEWRDRRYRYASTGLGGFKILDMVDPGRPKIIGSYLYKVYGESVPINAVAARGDRAYLAADNGYVVVLDISNKAAPSLVKAIATDGAAYDIVLNGDYAFVAKGVNTSTYDMGGIAVISLSTNTVTMDNFDSGAVFGVAVNGDTLLAAFWGGSSDKTARIHTIDIANPVSPADIDMTSDFSCPDSSIAFCLSGNVAYVASGPLTTIDVSDRANLGAPASMNVSPSTAYDVDVRGEYAFVTANGGSVLVYSLANPLAPVKAATFADADMSSARGIMGCGDLLYVTDSSKGLFVLDAANPTAITREAWLATGYGLTNTAIYGNYLYACESILTKAIDIFDISNMPMVTYVGKITTSASPNALEVAGDFLYAAIGSPGVAVYGLADPAAPALSKTINTYIAKDVKVRGNYAYVADYSGGFTVVDLTDDSIHTVAMGGDAQRLALSGNYAFVAVGSSLKVVDVSAPTNPVLLAHSASTNYAITDLKIVGTYAYVGTNGSGLGTIETFDLADPANIANVDSQSLYDPAYGIDANGSTVFISTPSEWIPFGLADPAKPAEGSSADTSLHAGREGAFKGAYAFIPGYNGIMVMDVSSPLSPTMAFMEGDFRGIR